MGQHPRVFRDDVPQRARGGRAWQGWGGCWGAAREPPPLLAPRSPQPHQPALHSLPSDLLALVVSKMEDKRSGLWALRATCSSLRKGVCASTMSMSRQACCSHAPPPPLPDSSTESMRAMIDVRFFRNTEDDDGPQHLPARLLAAYPNITHMDCQGMRWSVSSLAALYH